MLASECCALVNNSRFIIYIYSEPRWLLVFSDLAPGLRSGLRLRLFYLTSLTLKQHLHDTGGSRHFRAGASFYHYNTSRLSPVVVNRGGLSYPLKDVAVFGVKSSYQLQQLGVLKTELKLGRAKLDNEIKYIQVITQMEAC